MKTKIIDREDVSAAICSIMALGWMIIFPVVLCLLACGCMSDKGSHQNGLIFYITTSGVALGYGEAVDVPMGAFFKRTVSVSTNGVTNTMTEWDTRPVTNVVVTIPAE